MQITAFSVSLALAFYAAATLAGPRTDNDELTVRRICASRNPVLVIDTFAGNPTNEKNIDIDGDGEYDVHHGEFVARIAELNGQRTLRWTVGTPVFSPQVLEVLETAAAKIERGELRISWINFSQGFTVEIDSLNKLIGERGKVNDRNVHQYARRVLETLWTSRPKLKLRELHAAFLRLEKLGVPVVVAAANSGYSEVNLYSLFPNVLSVGALDLIGNKASYSADNSTVTLWRQGNILSYGVNGGMDFDGDGKADLPIDTPPIPAETLEALRGKRAATLVKRVPPDIDRTNDESHARLFDLTARLPEGLYSTHELLRKTLGTGFQQTRYIQSLGDYFYLDGKHPRPLVYFKVDTSGFLQVRQGLTENGRVYRNVLYGTSFASPNICNGARTPERHAL